MKKLSHVAETTSADLLIFEIELIGLQWDVGNTGINIEARIWNWPDVIGRYRPNKTEDLHMMLKKACIDAELM